MACEYQSSCEFFKMFGGRKSNVWKGMLGYYCKGDGFRICEGRRTYRELGRFQEYNLLPTGKVVSKAFFDLP